MLSKQACTIHATGVPLSKTHPQASSVLILTLLYNAISGLFAARRTAGSRGGDRRLLGKKEKVGEDDVGNKETNTSPKRVGTDETKMRPGSRTWSDNIEKH